MKFERGIRKVREDNKQARCFLVVAAFVFCVNIIGILYGIYAGDKYNYTKQIIQ